MLFSFKEVGEKKMKKRFIVFGIVLLLLTVFLIIPRSGNENLAIVQSVKAIPTSSQVIVDGEKIEFQAYNINGNNYFKLRDIAFILDGSEKQFEINWDETNNFVYITTEKPYTAIGGELSVSDIAGIQSATASTSRIFLNGNSGFVSAYNINGYNYFKLRDLGSRIDFGVTWDSNSNTIFVNTSKSYDDIVNNSVFGEIAYSHVEYIHDNLGSRISGTTTEKDTAQYIQSALKEAGYQTENLTLQSFEFKKDTKTYYSQNIIATKTGKDEREIIIGAHYDSVGTNGTDDNGGGVGTVLEAAARLIGEETPYTIRFIFFGAEENGFLGAKYYLNSLSAEEKKKIIVMINLDSILAGDQQYVFGGKYAEQAKEMADKTGIQLELNPALDSGALTPDKMADHVVFRNDGIPTIFFWTGNFEISPYNVRARTEVLGAIYHTEYDDLSVLNKYFPGRVHKRISDHSQMLYYILKYIRPAS